MLERYPRRTEGLVIVKGTQVTSRVCDNAALTGIFHFPVQRNTMYLQLWGSSADTGLAISYRLLYRLGQGAKEIKAATILRASGAYNPAAEGILSYAIPVTHGANECEVTVESASDIAGYLEALWVDAVGSMGVEYMARHTVVRAEPIAAGISEVISFLPAPGYIGQVQDFRFHFSDAPTPATSGTHTVTFYVSYGEIYTKTPYNIGPEFRCGGWRSASAIESSPASEVCQGDAMRNMAFDDIRPLNMEYVNGTDVAQSVSRVYVVLARYRRVK